MRDAASSNFDEEKLYRVLEYIDACIEEIGGRRELDLIPIYTIAAFLLHILLKLFGNELCEVVPILTHEIHLPRYEVPAQMQQNFRKDIDTYYGNLFSAVMIFECANSG